MSTNTTREDLNMVIAGFGGQGVLFSGKVVAYAGLMEDLQVSWLPSYGPEMRGGTANCSICISERPIGSPLVLNPDVLIAMNLPSFDKFIDTVKPGGIAVIDSDMITKKTPRTDITSVYIPATKLAEDNGAKGLANLVLVGRFYAERRFVALESLKNAIKKGVPPRKVQMIEANLKALDLGMNYF